MTARKEHGLATRPELLQAEEEAAKAAYDLEDATAAETDARMAAKAIANAPLVKTAIHGGDPNWGRLIAVAGRACRRWCCG